MKSYAAVWAHKALDVVLDAKESESFMTSAKATKVLRAAGYQESVAKGGGSYYFYGGEAHKWYSSSLNTYRISSWSAADIIRARNECARRNY